QSLRGEERGKHLGSARCARARIRRLFQESRRQGFTLVRESQIGHAPPRIRSLPERTIQKVAQAPQRGFGGPGDATARFSEHCAQRDRKSTRLNSSHVAISYAV